MVLVFHYCLIFFIILIYCHSIINTTILLLMSWTIEVELILYSIRYYLVIWTCIGRLYSRIVLHHWRIHDGHFHSQGYYQGNTYQKSGLI